MIVLITLVVVGVLVLFVLPLFEKPWTNPFISHARKIAHAEHRLVEMQEDWIRNDAQYVGYDRARRIAEIAHMEMVVATLRSRND